MESFLQDSIKSVVNLTNYDLIHLVVGNESCDLDSAVSSLVYAYLLKVSKYANDERTIVIPVLNVLRSDYQLKTELVFWLQEVAHLNLNLFIFKDDLNLNLRNEESTVLLTLVDHNEDMEFEKLGKLVEVIDHHQLTAKDRTKVEMTLDGQVGSCCTLIADKYLDHCQKVNLDPDVHLVLLLYGPIVLDTVCFSPTAQRYSQKDEDIVHRLEAILGPNLTREDVYQQLIRAKNSLASFSVEQVLVKDLKVVESDDGHRKFALSSISGSLIENYFNEDVFPQPLADFCLKHQYLGLIVLGIENSNPDQVKRDLAAYSANVDLFNKICTTLEDLESNLQLKTIWKTKNAKLWSQGNLKASRKIILPLVAKLIVNQPNSQVNNSVDTTRPVPKEIPLTTIKKAPPLSKQQISTADVDPEFLFNYRAETVDFPESPIAHISVEKSGNTESPVTGRKGKKEDTSSINTTSSTTTTNTVVDSESRTESVLVPSLVFNNVNSSNQNGGGKPLLTPRRQTSVISSSGSSQPPQLDSINYYESYFMDSYIGEFSGEVDVDKVNENCSEDQLSHWCSGSDLNDFNPELSFDSFGPESMLYSHIETTESKNPGSAGVSNQNHNGNQQLNPVVDLTNPDCDLQSLSVAEPQLVDKVRQCFDGSKIKTGYELTIEEDQSELKSESKGQEVPRPPPPTPATSVVGTPAEKSAIFKHFDVDELVKSAVKIQESAPTEDNQVKEPAITIEDKDDDEVLKTEDIQLEVDPPEEVNKEHLFVRNGALTQSMRRKISPKLKFDEILNTSDDLGSPEEPLPVVSTFESSNSINSGTDHTNGFTSTAYGDSNSETPSRKVSNVDVQSDFGTPIHNQVATHVRQNSTSTTKKKITVNRDFLDSDELPGDGTVPQPVDAADRRKVTFYGSGEAATIDTSANSSALHTSSNNGMLRTSGAEKIPELSAREEVEETRNWRPSCPIGQRGEVKRIDMKVIEPYKKVLSHGGYYHHYNSVQLTKAAQTPAPGPAVIIFSACYLPDRSRRDYEYVMDNLFMYVLTTLHELVADDYILIYFHNAGGSGITGNNMPTFSWLKRCYYMIDRRLRKNLKSLFLVHPTFWLKTLVIMTKPFVSSKFSRKLQFVDTLSELNDLVPIESTIIPPPVKQVEFSRMIRQKKKESKK